MLPHTSSSHFIITYSPLLHILPLFDINAKGVCCMAILKCDKKSKCTFKISGIVLSQFSCNTLLACNAIWTFVDNSIMWLAMEKLLSWMRVLECAMCFYNASMFGRIMSCIFISVALMLASSLSNYACILVKNMSFL